MCRTDTNKNLYAGKQRVTDLTLFVILLTLLIAADTILTAIAVGTMGATELNPLCALLGGLPAFLAVKAVVSAACLVGLLWLGRQMPKAAKIAAGGLCILYGIVVFGGAAGMVGAMA